MQADCNKETDLISVIIPVLDRAEHLARCIDSVLSQSYHNFELLLVDNGSTDGSLIICNSYRDKDYRVKVLIAPDKGVSFARNCGLSYSSGDYIAFIDSDDHVERDYLQKLLFAMKENGSSIAMCQYAEMTDGDKVVTYCFDRYDKAVSYDRLIIDAQYGRENVSYCWGKLWRRDAVIKEFMPFNYSEDHLFLYENLAGRSGSVALAREVLCCYERHEDSITGRRDIDNVFDAVKVAQRILHLAEKDNRSFIRSSKAQCIRFAFYALLSRKNGSVRHIRQTEDLCVRIIKKHRLAVLMDIKAPFRIKAACILSYMPMRLLRKVYSKYGHG